MKRDAQKYTSFQTLVSSSSLKEQVFIYIEDRFTLAQYSILG